MSLPSNYDVAIIQNVIAPYKSLLFNTLKRESGLRFKVIYLAKIEGNREWEIDIGELRFPHELLFDGKIEDVGQLELTLRVYKTLCANNPAVVVLGGYNHLVFWVGLVWAKVNRKKAILINESHYMDRRRWWFKEKVKQVLVSNCDAALVAGTRHKEYTVRLGLSPEKVFVKHGVGAIDVSWYQDAVRNYRKTKWNRAHGMKLRERNFLFVGRFSSEKNIMMLLRAFQRIKKNAAKEWGLILVGNGPQRREIENYVIQNQLDDVVLPGFKVGKELCLFYALSDVLVLPSISEPWGLVVNEALACELPVIVSNRCGCFPDIVRDGINGFSFDPMDEEELSQRMSAFAHGRVDGEMMGQRSRQIVAELTPSSIAATYREAITFVRVDAN